MKCCPRFGAGTVSCKKRKERRRDILLQFCLHCWIRWPFQCEADITSPVYTTVVPRTDLLVYVGRGQELLLNVGVRLKQWVHFSVGTVIRSDDEKFLLQLPRRGRKCVHISARALHGSEWITKKKSRPSHKQRKRAKLVLFNSYFSYCPCDTMISSKNKKGKSGEGGSAHFVLDTILCHWAWKRLQQRMVCTQRG